MAKSAGNVMQMQRSRPLLEQVIERQSVTVDAEVTGATTIFTTTSGLGQFVVTGVVIEVATCTAEPNTPQATITVGTAAGSDADVIQATSLTGTLGLRDYVVLIPVEGGANAVPASTALRVNVTVAAVTSGALTYKVHVIGFYTGT